MNNKQKIYLIVLATHFLEHVVQMFQLYILKWPRAESLGILGLKYPMLVHNETLHFGFAIFTILGLFLFKPDNFKAYRWWNNTLAFSTFHFFDHSLLMYQFLTKNYFFGESVPTALGQLWFPRLELHFFYNLVITIFICIFVYHQTKRRNYVN